MRRDYALDTPALYPLNAPLIRQAVSSSRGEMVCDSVGYRPHSPVACAPNAASPDLPWYVLQTKPNVEFRVMNGVTDLGYRAYFPRRLIRRRRYGRLEQLIQALFPSYLLVCMDAARDPWGDILRLPDVRRFLCGPGGPVALRVGEIERLMDMGRAGDGVIDGQALPMKAGTALRVLKGPFVDWSAVCELDDGSRVEVLLTLFGRKQRVEMPREFVEALGV